ncbi:hypothetical protein LINPERPRIM_LOCUS20318, partial [Linum perenne]
HHLAATANFTNLKSCLLLESLNIATAVTYLPPSILIYFLVHSYGIRRGNYWQPSLDKGKKETRTMNG